MSTQTPLLLPTCLLLGGICVNQGARKRYFSLSAGFRPWGNRRGVRIYHCVTPEGPKLFRPWADQWPGPGDEVNPSGTAPQACSVDAT